MPQVVIVSSLGPQGPTGPQGPQGTSGSFLNFTGSAQITGSLSVTGSITFTGLFSNTTTPQASAVLQADSTTQGFLPPRMTTTQKNAIATPAAGLVVYDSTTNKLCCYNGTTWNDLF